MAVFRRFSHDALAGLKNRAEFCEHVQHVVDAGKETGLAVVYTRMLNLDAFSVRRGADAADEAVTMVARHLLDAVPRSRIGHFSSGAFGILAPADVIEDIVGDINRELPTSGEASALVVKAGYCEILGDLTVMDALERARYAFDDIRYESPAYTRLFDRGLQRAFERRAYVVEHLDDAIERGEIRAYAQPIVRVLTGLICEVEILARWESEEFGFLRPDEFIPELERTQLIHRLDSEVVRLACKQWAEASAKGINVPFGINLSRLDFELTDIYRVVTDAMRTWHVPVDQVHIEVTESALSHSNVLLSSGIDRFKAAGFTLYLDDFGSGYSSLRVLEGTRFDVVKLDMSLLREIEENERARVIVADAISMVKRLALQTLCEGVETLEQFLFLKAVGCEKAQGYFFGKPMSHEEIMAHLEKTASMHERPEDQRYYDSIGRVNLMDGTRTNVQGVEAAHFIGTQSFAIAEVKGTTIHFLAANSAFMRFVSRKEGLTIQELEEMLAGSFADIRTKALYTAEKAKATGRDQRFDFVLDGSFCTLSVSHIETSERRDAYLTEVVSVTRDSQYNSFRLLERSLRFLYTIFKRIDLLDMTDQTWQNIYLNVPRYSGLVASGTPREEIEAFCATFIHPDDRTRFLEFYDLDTADERLRATGGAYLADTFSALSNYDRYIEQLFMLIPISLDGHRQFLSCMRDLDTTYQARSKLTGNARISDEVLLSGILDSPRHYVYWKDEQRRFVGANKAFLDYYGFGSVRDIYGKTDEDLGWGLRNPDFADVEGRVLDGDPSSGAMAITIHDGELRNISISRLPLFREGRIIGLVGYFIDLSRHVTFEEAVEEVRQEVLDRGYRRSVILGTPEVMAGGLLRRNIAASGVMVLAPGEADRRWIGDHLVCGFAGADLERLQALLKDALSHGADSLVVCHATLLDAVERLAIGAPILDATKLAWFD